MGAARVGLPLYHSECQGRLHAKGRPFFLTLPAAPPKMSLGGRLREAAMGMNLAAISDLPVAAWIVLLAAAAFVGEYVLLRLRQRRSARAAELSERRLALLATALRDYAAANMQRLPATLAELGAAGAEAVAYRPAPRLNLDARLILLHDREPTHKVLEFPVLRDGRGLVFCSGRLLVVSQEVFEKLIAADDALRTARPGKERRAAARGERRS